MKLIVHCRDAQDRRTVARLEVEHVALFEPLPGERHGAREARLSDLTSDQNAEAAAGAFRGVHHIGGRTLRLAPWISAELHD